MFLRLTSWHANQLVGSGTETPLWTPLVSGGHSACWPSFVGSFWPSSACSRAFKKPEECAHRGCNMRRTDRLYLVADMNPIFTPVYVHGVTCLKWRVEVWRLHMASCLTTGKSVVCYFILLIQTEHPTGAASSRISTKVSVFLTVPQWVCWITEPYCTRGFCSVWIFHHELQHQLTPVSSASS